MDCSQRKPAGRPPAAPHRVISAQTLRTNRDRAAVRREKARRNIAAKASRAFARSHSGKLAHNSDITTNITIFFDNHAE